VLVGTAACGSAAAEESLLIATTTSLRDSGLLAELLPEFEGRTGIRPRIIAVGSGAALRMGAEGNADLLLTHAPEGERKLVESGFVRTRRPFMMNYFVIAGPRNDPAQVSDAPDAAAALRAIATRPAAFVSRGDDSGTHRRERSILRAAGLDPDGGWKGYLSSGAGMGVTLQVAGERRAYTLSDLGTFLAFRERTALVAFSREEPMLRNEYSVLRVDPARFPEGRIHGDAARRAEEFLLSPGIQERIGSYGVERFGRPLFTPLATRARPEAAQQQ
jgi:tungstate transport system substrate-binding protein